MSRVTQTSSCPLGFFRFGSHLFPVPPRTVLVYSPPALSHPNSARVPYYKNRRREYAGRSLNETRRARLPEVTYNQIASSRVCRPAFVTDPSLPIASRPHVSDLYRLYHILHDKCTQRRRRRVPVMFAQNFLHIIYNAILR